MVILTIDYWLLDTISLFVTMDTYWLLTLVTSDYGYYIYIYIYIYIYYWVGLQLWLSGLLTMFINHHSPVNDNYGWLLLTITITITVIWLVILLTFIDHSCYWLWLIIDSLVGALEHFLFSHILGRIIPTDELIFFRGVGIPPTSSGYDYYYFYSTNS